MAEQVFNQDEKLGEKYFKGNPVPPSYTKLLWASERLLAVVTMDEDRDAQAEALDALEGAVEGCTRSGVRRG